MAKTINFCGDSFCERIDSPSSWIRQLADLLSCEIIGKGKSGTSHEHAIRSFDASADFTVFCWTEPDRIYHPTNPLNFGTAEKYKSKNKIYAAAHAYYAYVHDFEYSKTRQMRELYWFDHAVLSNYSGKIAHCWCFEQTYDFLNGVTFDKILNNLEKTDDYFLNHLTKQENTHLAHELYNLIRKTNGQV